MSRASHPQSRQSVQIKATRPEQKIWARFVAETRNEDEFVRIYAVDDRKKEVYIRLKELYWTLWRFIGRKRSWAEGRHRPRSMHCELRRSATRLMVVTDMI